MGCEPVGIRRDGERSAPDDGNSSYSDTAMRTGDVDNGMMLS